MGFVKTDTIGITIMSEKIIKWGFIGCGEVTKTKSGPAFQKVEHSEVVAVMSRDGAKAKAYAKERGIKKWYDDAQELIDDPEVNAIYIATPPSSHATYAIMAMKAGKPAYIEKPMAQTYEECTRINRISQETGIPCFVAYYRRYLPYFQKVKELVENGSIGNVINVQIRFAQPPRDLDYNRENLPWRVQADIAGGGNFHSTYASAGAYDSVAEVLFEKENVDAYYLEFDDERSGGFETLAHVNGDKKVVLGLITTKSPKLENKADVIARIKEAQKYISLDRLCLSPQCGFASCEIGNKLTEEEQWAKLQLVKEIAEEVWR